MKPAGSVLTYSWNQIDGLNVVLNDAASVDPTFIAPETTTQIHLTFQLTVTNEEGITSEPDEVIVTVSPLTTSHSPEEPQTIKGIIKNIIQNPLDITNSTESSNKIIDILRDGNSDNYQLACDPLDDTKN